MNKWNQVVSPMIQFGIMSFISLSVGALSAYAYLEVRNAESNTPLVLMVSDRSESQDTETEFIDPDQAEGEDNMIDPNAESTTLFAIPGDCLSDITDRHEQRNLSTQETDLSGTARRIEHPAAYTFQSAADPINGAERFFEVSQTSAAPSSPRIVGIEFYTAESIAAADSEEQGPFQGMTAEEYQEVQRAFEEEHLPSRGKVQQIHCRAWIAQTVQGAGEAFWLRFYDTVVDDQVIRITLIQDNTQYNGFLTGQIQDAAADELFGLFRLR